MNCVASPGHYAESSEILAKAQKRKHHIPHDYKQEFNSQKNGSGKHHSKKVVQQEKPSVEPKQVHVNTEFLVPRASNNVEQFKTTSQPIVQNNNDLEKSSLETQELAESASFVGRQRNVEGFVYNRPIGDVKPAASTTGTPTPYRGTMKYQGSSSELPRYDSSPNGVNTVTPTPIVSTKEPKPNTFFTVRRIEPTKSTPYYSPTIPRIQVHTTTPAPPSIPTVAAIPSLSDHAMEMLKTLQELSAETSSIKGINEHVSDVEEQLKRTNTSDSVNSLALYFATVMDNITSKLNDTSLLDEKTERSTTVEAATVTNFRTSTPSQLPSDILSSKILNDYENIFTKNISMDPITMNAMNSLNHTIRMLSMSSEDLDTEFSNNPVLSAMGTTRIRELAQVFTQALSAYLHDPISFKKILSEIRPTEPPALTNEVETIRDGKSRDFKEGTGATYLPTVPTTLAVQDELEVLDFSDVTPKKSSDERTEAPTIISTINPSDDELNEIKFVIESKQSVPDKDNIVPDADKTPASRYLSESLEKQATDNLRRTSTTYRLLSSHQNNLALEINGGLQLTTQFPYLHGDSDEAKENIEKNSLPTESPIDDTPPASTISPLAVDLLPPDNQNNFDDSDLQRAQSQSFVANGNAIYNALKNNYHASKRPDVTTLAPEDLTTVKGHFITQSVPTTITPSATDEIVTLANRLATQPDINSWSTVSYTETPEPSTINDEIIRLSVTESSVPESLASRNNFDDRNPKVLTGDSELVDNGNIEQMESKAMEMFGKLNETSADHLMNVMKTANENKMVRKLILLLIQTCGDEDYNKTVEDSRQALLDALIRMDEQRAAGQEIKIIHTGHRQNRKLDHVHEINNLLSESFSEKAETTTVPITTYRRPFFNKETTSSYQNPQTQTTFPQTYGPHFFDKQTTVDDDEFLKQYTDSYRTTTDFEPTEITTLRPSSDQNEYRVTQSSLSSVTAGSPSTTESLQSESKGRRVAKHLDNFLAQPSTFSVSTVHKHSDARALELLRSLYNLATTFGNR